jgi:S1-C subfamily serine protease
VLLGDAFDQVIDGRGGQRRLLDAVSARRARAALRAACFAFLSVVLTATAFAQRSSPARETTTATPRPVTPRGPLTAEERNTIEIFERVSRSVVYITTVQHVRDFFSRNVMRVPQGTGSGFIWDDRGHVVTNYHVIRGAQEALVTLADQRSYPARLVGVSPDHDIAVLRIDLGENPPPPVPIGSSAELKVGQTVYAIGNPFGLDHTLTSGIVSALNRSIDNDRGGTIENLIQTDAAINPGNSGGPLIDSAGRLVGINTMIYSPSGAYAGIGFAVPVDTVNRVVPRIIAYGRYIRPTIGIRANDEVSARLLGRNAPPGVLILGVEPGSPAERAGLVPTQRTPSGRVILGDVIEAIDGEEVATFSDLIGVLDERGFGDRVRLIVRRGDTRRNVDVTLSLEGE